jgi:DNA-directed RNA polymerase specialized sigma24 family protein
MVDSETSRSEVGREVEEQLLDAQHSESARRKLFTTIYQEFYPVFRAKLHRAWSSDKLHDPAIDADDIIQETLFKAYRNLDSFCGNNIAQVLAWILAIAQNEMRDKIKIAQRRRRRGTKHCQVNERPLDPQRLVNLIDPRGEEPFEILATSEESEQLQLLCRGNLYHAR